MNMTVFVAAALAVATLVSGCATQSSSGGVYSARQSRQGQDGGRHLMALEGDQDRILRGQSFV